MKKVVIMGLVLTALGMAATAGMGESVMVTGAGASFPDPIYQKWRRSIGHWRG